MDIQCKACQKGFHIPDEKLPKQKTITISCPGCKNKIQIDTKKSKLSGYSPLDFEPSILGEGGKKALVCDDRLESQKILQATLEGLGYRVSVSTRVENVVDKLRFDQYDLILLNETFSGYPLRENPVLHQIQRMPMVQRRNTFLGLVGKNFKTLNPMMAFSKSANLVIHEKDLPRLPGILNQALSEGERFYRIFRESIRDIGKR